MSGFQLQRQGQMMEPEPGNLPEAEGVLNTAAFHGADGKLYLFPQLVSGGDYSRINLARVRFNDAATHPESSGEVKRLRRTRLFCVKIEKVNKQ